MGNCLSKFNYKPPFTLHMPPLTTGHLKKVANGIRKNPVKYFSSGIHRIETIGIKDLHKVLRVVL